MVHTPHPAVRDSRLASVRPSRRGSRLTLLLALSPLISMTGCATKADIRDLRESMVELSAQQNAVLREIQADQEAQADSIRAVTRALQEFRAESLRRIMSIEDQLLRVQELAGLSQQELARVRDQLDRDRALAAFGGQGVPTGDGAGAGSSAQETYVQARGQLERGQLTAARMGFQDVVALYGNDPLAPEARFYLADILEQEGQLEAAIDAFLEVQQYHPAAPKVPEALYRAARLYAQTGDRQEAEALFERVLNTWPESLAADLAREALRDLR